tara:strand:- start:416 stop:601 length:186 start_codon:yes stop_codon:yes gene_type:complete
MINFIKSFISRIETFFQLFSFVFKNLDFGKLLLIFALFIASILFLVFKLFEFMAPFTYLAL